MALTFSSLKHSSNMKETEPPAFLPAETTTSTSIPGNANQEAKSNRNDELKSDLTGGTIEEPDPYPSRSGEQPAQSAQQASHEAHEGAWIGYRVEFKDPVTDQIIDRRTSRTPAVEESFNISPGNEPIFERVTTYKARPSSDKFIPMSNAEADSDADLPRALGPASSYSIIIYSTAIVNALRTVVSYYPSQDLSRDVLRIDWPYRILVHHYDELVDFRKQVMSRTPEDLCVRERDAAEHLEMLIKFLDDAVMVDIRAEAERNKRGFSTYEHFWYPYRPGCVVMLNYLGNDNSKWDTHVVQKVSGGPTLEHSGVWDIDGWSLGFDGTLLDRKLTGGVKDPFTGEYEFKSSTHFIYDRTSLENEEVQKKIGFGKRYWELIQKQCQHYKGKSCDFPYNEVRSPIQVHFDSDLTLEFFFKKKYQI